METKSSNYALYVKEREGQEIIEDHKGFITYEYHKDCVFIGDLFVRTEYRHEGHGTLLFQKVVKLAKSKGFNKATCTVDPDTNGSSYALLSFLRYGFKLACLQDDMIYLSKEI